MPDHGLLHDIPIAAPIEISHGWRAVRKILRFRDVKWQLIQIAFHPSGDPKNMKELGNTALIGKLR